MKKICIMALVILGLYLPVQAFEMPGPFVKENAARDGRLIAEITKDFNRPAKDMVIYAVMTLKSGKTVTDTRKVIIKEKTYADLQRALFRFMDSMKRGLTFLTIETHGRNNDQYLYTPAIGRPRQIASQDRQNDFEDTDLTNEDLGGLKLDDYTYRRGKDRTIGGRPCFRITAIAKDRDARFPRKVSWIDRETFVPVRVKVYNRDNKLERVLAAGDIRKIGNIHIAFKTVAKNLIQNHVTILQVVKAQVDTGIDSAAFDKEKMGEPWAEHF